MKSRKIKKTESNGALLNKKAEIRITTGIAKNKRLKAPSIEGFRAVQEIAKSSLFSILGEKIENAVCLDLFAGSGNMGLEALSRGADWCDFVDDNYFSSEAIKENILNCGFLEKSEVFRKESSKFVVNAPKKYDLIFLDPFYDDVSQRHLISNLGSILNNDGVAIFFHGENLDIEKLISSTEMKIMEERKFGKSIFTILSVTTEK